MSRVYFHSPSNESEVRGSERSFAALLINRMFISAIGVSEYDRPDNPHVLRRIISPSHYCLRDSGKRFAESLETALAVSFGSPVLTVQGKDVDIFSAALNTGLVMGSNAVKFGARLHGQCEIHAFVEGPNRDWLAGIVNQGLRSGVLRNESGWESVVAHLRERDDEPVVTSFSVCEQFPNAGIAKAKGIWTPPGREDGEESWDAWYELPNSEQWSLALAALRSKPLLEMKPENWDTFYFGDGTTGFDLLAAAIELDKAAR